MKSFLSHLAEVVIDPTTWKIFSLAGISALCTQLAPIVSVLAGLATVGYCLYRWRRDARERTCDKAHCPLRHLPE